MEYLEIMEDDIYKTWKPIRNFLRRVDPKISLEVLRYYSLFKGSLNEVPPTPPSYIEVNRNVLNRGTIGILPWDIELLANEVVHSSNEGLTDYRYDLRKWRDFANLMQKLRVIDNKISEVGISQDNVLMEMFRIGHRQFPHQQDTLSTQSIARYGRLFSDSRIEPIALDRMGIPYGKLIVIGGGYWGVFQEYAAINQPTEGMQGTDITLDDINIFLSLYSRSFLDIKQLVKASHTIDNTFLYQYSPLNAYPLVKFERNGETTYVCTSVNRFAFQITKGVYYMLYQDSRFDNAFGDVFEDYVGDVIRNTIDGTAGCSLYSQEVDSSDRKRRCDWILEQDDEFIMVECKTKRLAIGGYVNLDDQSILLGQLDILAEAVVQTYEGYMVYKGVGYNPPVYPYSSRKKGAVCVVTLEKWYLYGEVLDQLHKIVRNKLSDKGIDASIIDEAPYEVMGVDTFERLVYLAANGESIRSIFEEHSKGDQSTHEFATYAFNNYEDKMENYRYIFEDDLDMYLQKVKES